MTEHTAWSDLPNAKYIDLVMDSLKKNPAAWTAAWYAAKTAAWDAAQDAARGAAWAAARAAAKDAINVAAWNAASAAAKDAARGMGRDAARDTVLALFAWDNYGYLLEENPEDVKMLALLGNQAAVLLYTACLALQNTKELEIT
jgi:hypothetical protein